MGEWDILGGDPAPGSVSSVNNAVKAFVRVADFASDAESKLVRAGSELGAGSWTGKAAEAFRSNLSELPSEIKSVAVSHRDASRALARFRDALEEAQRRARQLKARALESAEEIARNEAAAERAEANKTAAADKLGNSQARLVRLRLQRSATLDPAAATTLQSQISTTAAQVKRYTAERDAAAAEETRYRRLAEAARQRLKSLMDDARRLHGTLAQEAEMAARGLASAEKNAHLPGAYDRFLTDLNETVADYGPVFVESFDLGVTLFNVAAAVFPPGAAVFKGCALILGGLSIGAQLAVAGCARDGMTTDRLLKILGTALSIGAGVGGKAAKAFTVGDQVVDGVRNYRESGVKGVLIQGGFLLGGFGLSKAVDKVGGPALRSAMAKLDKDPKTQTKLRDISRAVREAGDSGSKLVDKNGCRVTQSILKGSNIPPGGWLPGNSGMPAADPAHLADHAVRDVVQASAESDAVVALPEAVLDAVEDKVEEYFKRPDEDHLVNINAQVKR